MSKWIVAGFNDEITILQNIETNEELRFEDKDSGNAAILKYVLGENNEQETKSVTD